jgi:hypothetical protein
MRSHITLSHQFVFGTTARLQMAAVNTKDDLNFTAFSALALRHIASRVKIINVLLTFCSISFNQISAWISGYCYKNEASEFWKSCGSCLGSKYIALNVANSALSSVCITTNV